MADHSPGGPRDGADEFYVGYLPTPPRHLRFVRRLVWATLVWIVGLGVLIAVRAGDPGPGVWDTAATRIWTGDLVTEPYPMLIPDDGGAALLIVEMGKTGAHDRVATLAGRRVEIRGYLLERDGRRMIELDADRPGADAVAALDPDAPAIAPPVDVAGATAEIELSGEIVDGKCFLGAMKPGDGPSHKSCATLCIRGGLPPMLLTRENGRPVFRLLLIDGQGALPEPLLALVAEPVRIRGELSVVHGVPVISAKAAGVTLR